MSDLLSSRLRENRTRATLQQQMQSLNEPDNVCDFYFLNELLTDEERAVRDRVRTFCDKEVIPVIGNYWERGEFPVDLVPRLASLGIAGDTIVGYGCPGMSKLAAGLVVAELARGDGSLNTFLGVHTALAMSAINFFGSEEQKNRWLPPMARLDKIGAFAVTEPDHGSDAIALETKAHREGDFWVLNGRKKWISNASFADVVAVWARTSTGQVSCFLVEKGSPGFTATVITGKIAMRATWQTEITLDNVRVPVANHLVGARSFNDVMKILNLSRYGVSWAALGHSMACYEYALAYAKQRKQFNKPLVNFQLIQQKLARMLGEITSMQFLCFRLSQLIEQDRATAGMISLAKMQTALKSRQVVADARDILGANGILVSNHVARHMGDMEGIFTAEGSDNIQALTVGREITNVQIFW